MKQNQRHFNYGSQFVFGAKNTRVYLSIFPFPIYISSFFLSHLCLSLLSFSLCYLQSDYFCQSFSLNSSNLRFYLLSYLYFPSLSLSLALSLALALTLLSFSPPSHCCISHPDSATPITPL